MPQISLSKNQFVFLTGNDPTAPGEAVFCSIIDVFHKKIFARVSNNRRARVVSFIYESAGLNMVSPTVPSLHLRAWVMYLSQGAPDTDWIGGNIEISRWHPGSTPGLKIEDNFTGSYEPSPAFLPYETGHPFEPITIGAEIFAPINLLMNQKVVAKRPNDSGPTVDSRLLVLYRPALYKSGPGLPNAATISTNFYALGYESYRLSEAGLGSQLSIITNPRIKENFL